MTSGSGIPTSSVNLTSDLQALLLAIIGTTPVNFPWVKMLAYLSVSKLGFILGD
jgi:hypothetical protein